MKSVIVVDLDGTLSNINTFHAFIKHILILALKTFDIMWGINIIFWTLIRGIKIISHKKWKYEILKFSYRKNTEKYKFIDDLSTTINKDILKKLNDYDVRILATGAPSIYVELLAKKYGFTHWCATSYNSSYTVFFENLRLSKYKTVQKILSNLKMNKIDLLVTDHIDDAELILYAKSVLLFRANKELVTFVENNKIGLKVNYIY